MNVIVDTCVWSCAFRRENTGSPEAVLEFRELLKEMRVQMIGPIRQEVLSGIKTEEQYLILKEHLRAFPDLPLITDDFELAAEFYNTARKNGIQGSNTDFLICAVASRHALAIFTTDRDFLTFKKHLPITLHQARILS